MPRPASRRLKAAGSFDAGWLLSIAAFIRSFVRSFMYLSFSLPDVLLRVREDCNDLCIPKLLRSPSPWHCATPLRYLDDDEVRSTGTGGLGAP